LLKAALSRLLVGKRLFVFPPAGQCKRQAQLTAIKECVGISSQTGES